MNIRCVVCSPIDPLVLCSCSRPSTKRDVKGVNYACLTLVVFVFIASCSWVASRVEAAAIDERVAPAVVVAGRDVQTTTTTTTAPAPVTVEPAPPRLLATVRNAPMAPGYTHVPVGCVEILPLILSVGLPEWMSLVAWRESRCKSGALRDDVSTGDLSYGYFQINTLGYLWGEIQDRCQVSQREELLEPVTNVRCAGALYRAYGYKPWDSGLYFE
jgi:hypothetical protein